MSDQTNTALPDHELDDQRIEIVIGTLLRTGVILAAAVVIFGATIFLSRHGHEIPHYGRFHGEPERLKTVSEIVRGAFSMSGSAIIQLGLLLLVATPVARVAFSVFAFAAERDYLYVVITLIVLGILMYGLLGTS
jgi:uncharacterized membrane protein